MIHVAKKELFRLIPTLAALVAFSLGAVYVGANSIRAMHRGHAEFVSAEFASLLNTKADQIRPIIQNDTAPAQVMTALQDVPLVGSVYAFRLYDMNGQLKMDSAWLKLGYSVGAPFGAGNITLEKILADGKSEFELSEGDGKTAPEFFSHNFVAINFDGEAAAILETFVDESTTWPFLINSFSTTAITIIGLFLLAALLPIWLYLKRAGQLEFVANKLSYSSEHDLLTGVLNRSSIYRRATKLIAERPISDPPNIAVYVIDIAKFKHVNEVYGHAEGDEILRRVARRIKWLVGTDQLVGRIGGDSFCVVQTMSFGTEGEAESLAKRLNKVLTRPFKSNMGEIEISPYIGHSRSPDHGETIPQLLRAAEVAVDHAKHNDSQKIVGFSLALASERERRQRIETLLRKAISENLLELHYQPYVAAKTSDKAAKAVGFEALLRLRSPDGGFISPDVFVPIAEEIGIISEIGAWVLQQACAQATQWPKTTTVSVNMSPIQFSDGLAVSAITHALRQSGLAPERLEIEVTESILIADAHSVENDLRAIKQTGASVSLDDFGTGYSSLAYLWQFPFDKLKVDKSLIDNVADKEDKSRNILETIVAMAGVLKMTVTAEGVERVEQAETLRELNCDLMQGYFFARPMPADEIQQFLNQESEAKPQALKRKRVA